MGIKTILSPENFFKTKNYEKLINSINDDDSIEMIMNFVKKLDVEYALNDYDVEKSNNILKKIKNMSSKEGFNYIIDIAKKRLEKYRKKILKYHHGIS